MEEIEIIEGNKLIAEFMGHIYSIHPEINEWEMKQLKYHKSWDWLMRVKEKIDSIDNNEYDVIIWRSDCHINDRVQILFEASIFKGDHTLIQIVWKCFVEFIKWHNQNKPHD